MDIDDTNTDDTTNTTEPTTPEANDDETITLSKSELSSLTEAVKNREWASARRHFQAVKEKPSPPQPAELSAHMRRAMELVGIAENVDATTAKQRMFLDAVKLPSDGKRPTSSSTTTATHQPQSELGQLLELMRMDIASRMADKLPKAPVQYASPGDELRASINEAVAAIPESDPARHTKVQTAVRERLRGVRIVPGHHNPNSALLPTKK